MASSKKCSALETSFASKADMASWKCDSPAPEGSRLGQPKALVEIGGQTLAQRGVMLLRDGGAAPVMVVTGAVAVTLPGVLTVHNPDWRAGMGSSLAAGLAAVPDDCHSAVIALADQPLIGPEAVRRLIAAAAGGASIA